MNDTNWQNRANAATAVLRREAMKADPAAQALFDKYAPTAAQRRAWTRKEAAIEAKVKKAISMFRRPLPVSSEDPSGVERLGGSIRSIILHGKKLTDILIAYGFPMYSYDPSVGLFVICDSDKVREVNEGRGIYAFNGVTYSNFISSPVECISELSKLSIKSLLETFDRVSKKAVI